MDELKQRMIDYKLHQLAVESKSNIMVERELENKRNPKPITDTPNVPEPPSLHGGSGSSSSGLVRNVIGGVIDGVASNLPLSQVVKPRYSPTPPDSGDDNSGYNTAEEGESNMSFVASRLFPRYSEEELDEYNARQAERCQTDLENPRKKTKDIALTARNNLGDVETPVRAFTTLRLLQAIETTSNINTYLFSSILLDI